MLNFPSLSLCSSMLARGPECLCSACSVICTFFTRRCCWCRPSRGCSCWGCTVFGELLSSSGRMLVLGVGCRPHLGSACVCRWRLWWLESRVDWWVGHCGGRRRRSPSCWRSCRRFWRGGCGCCWLGSLPCCFLGPAARCRSRPTPPTASPACTDGQHRRPRSPVRQARTGSNWTSWLGGPGCGAEHDPLPGYVFSA